MMRRGMLLAVVMLAVVFSATTMAQGPTVMTIAGSGTGANETPTPDASAGVAWVSCTIDRGLLQIACTARVHNIVDLQVGHIHVGGPGASGPVVLTITNLPVGVSDDFALNILFTQANLTPRPAQGVNTMLDVIESCSSGNCYMNFHTRANPGGEIRIPLCPEHKPVVGAGQPPGRLDNPFFQINICSPQG